MVTLDTLRGEDSTGMLSVTTAGVTDIMKEVCNGFDIKNHKNYFSFFSKNYVLLMGHNRAATKGKITRFNAHPFECGNIIGAHNGTLTSTYNLKDHQLFDVDSENIFHHINECGLIDLVSKANGAFALTWFNKEERTINFIRNDQRELWYAFSEDGKTIFWASEPWMFQVACMKNNIKLGTAMKFDVGHHYKVQLNYVVAGQATEIDMQKSDKLELYKYQYQYQGYQGKKTFPAQHKGKDTKTGQSLVAMRGGAPDLGDTVEVRVVAHVHGKQAYINTELVNRSGVIRFVRIYASYASALWDLLLSSQNNFMVKLKRVGEENRKSYFVADLRSVSEIEPDDAEEEVLVKGPDNRYISVTEWQKLLSDGCVYCSESDINPDKADELVWISGNYFVCPDCVDNHAAYIAKGAI